MLKTKKEVGDFLRLGWLLLIPIVLISYGGLYKMRDHNRLIVMSPQNTYHITEYAGDKVIKDTYRKVVRDATMSFLMRNPGGLDNAELFDILFIGEGKEIAVKQIQSEVEQFSTYKIHQKAEIQSIKIIKADKQRSYVEVNGQLIRSYIAIQQKRTWTVKFTATYELTVNHDFAAKGYYPFLITDLKYKQIDLSKYKETK